MCIQPKLIANPKYKPNKKNGGNAPVLIDRRVKYVAVGCQNCFECQRKRANEWRARLMYEVEQEKPKWIALTFSNESIKKIVETGKAKVRENKVTKIVPIKELEGYEMDNAIAKQGVRWFLERWRKEHSISVKHWLVTELGHNGTENIHLHGFIWTKESYDTIRRIWNYGYIWPRKEKEHKVYVSEKSINYMVKYVNKKDFKHYSYKPIILCSSGIGAGWEKTGAAIISQFKDEKTLEYTRTKQGSKIGIPIYWRNKIYTEEEREKLWIERIKKDTRYIDGVKIDKASKEIEYLLAVLHTKQDKNRELGYKKIEWEARKYENEIRTLLNWKRINNTQATLETDINTKE